MIEMTDRELQVVLENANLPTVLVLLRQLTGDPRWLEDPYLPARPKALEDNDDAGLPPHRQDEIIDAAVGVLGRWRDGELDDPAPPTDEQITAWLSASLGEQVPAGEAPMMAEEAGFRSRDVAWANGAPARAEEFTVAVIGAGVAGICMSAKLNQLGIRHTIFEKDHRVGGTWLENDYPGAGVDTPSHLYSFSFAPNPSWSRFYAKQPEILDYLEQVAQQHGVQKHVRFGTEVTDARFDPESGRWVLAVRDRTGTHEYRADVLVSAVGQLNRPQIPTIAGMDEFEGPAFHSAQWRHDIDLTGKRVGVVGVGATAMQVIPAIAGIPASVDVFQRSPQWVAPNGRYLSRVNDNVRRLLEQVPLYAAWYRLRMLWMFNDKLHPSIQIDPTWPYPERAVSLANDKHREFFTEYLMQELDGRDDLIAKALPDYPPYGKRILMDNDWFTTIRRDDVRIVTDDIDRIAGDAVITVDGERHPVDVLVYATGFQSKRMLYPMTVTGVSGQTLRELWGDDDARAYLGMSVPEFPNLFITYGPNTNLGHGGSVIFHTECQVNYIARMIVAMLEGDIHTVECRQDVHDAYNMRVDAAHERMIWTHRGMGTWYRNEQGRVVTNTPWRLSDYWAMTQRPDLSDFHITRRAAEGISDDTITAVAP